MLVFDKSEIRNALISAGFLNIKTYTKHNTTWLCAVGGK